jgi:hypothetical protein
LSTELLPYQQLDPTNPGCDPAAWFNIVGAVGGVLWIAAYLLIYERARRDRTYGLPLLAICLNFSWEFLAVWVWPNPVSLWRWLDRLWLGFDLLLVWQLLKNGRREMAIPEVRRFFFPMLALLTAGAMLAEHSFAMTYFDRLGLVTAFLINLVMSALFIPFFFARRSNQRGLSRPAAWCKMLGTLGTAIECHVVVRFIDPELPSRAFLSVLCASIFLLDCSYIALLTFARDGATRTSMLPDELATVEQAK